MIKGIIDASIHALQIRSPSVSLTTIYMYILYFYVHCQTADYSPAVRCGLDLPAGRSPRPVCWVPSIIGYRIHGYLRAVLLLTAEKLGQLTEVVTLVALGIAALGVPSAHARLIVLDLPNQCTQLATYARS